MIAYKFLRSDGTSPFTGFRWVLPEGEPGPWVDARVDPCRSGVHACRGPRLPLWVSQALYEIELEGEIVEGRSKLVAPRGRLLRRIVTWDDELSDTYTRMCADRAHELARGVAPPLDSWDAVVEPSLPEGPALLGFVAARIAEEISGPEAYEAERTAQAAWLIRELELETEFDAQLEARVFGGSRVSGGRSPGAPCDEGQAGQDDQVEDQQRDRDPGLVADSTEIP